jgi:hypothetical protein
MRTLERTRLASTSGYANGSAATTYSMSDLADRNALARVSKDNLTCSPTDVVLSESKNRGRNRVRATIACMSEAKRGGAPVSRNSWVGRQIQPRIAPLALLALGLAVIAAAIAIWALVRAPQSNTAPAATSQQTADAKGRACTAFNTVRQAVSLETHADLGTDPVAVQAVAANARLAMTAGASYLRDRLDPATPADVAAALRSFARGLEDISMYAQAGVANTDPAQAARLHDAEAADARIAELCR